MIWTKIRHAIFAIGPPFKKSWFDLASLESASCKALWFSQLATSDTGIERGDEAFLSLVVINRHTKEVLYSLMISKEDVSC